MTQVLDRDRPLWELWFVEGVDGGEHVGLIHKSHHTLTDGISGVDIATVLLDFTREPDRARPPTSGTPEPPPDPARLVRRHRARARHRVRPRSSSAARQAGRRATRRARRARSGLGRSIGVAGRGQLDRAAPVAQRAGRAQADGSRPCGSRSTTCKRVREAFGCTVNDVVLAGVGGGVGAAARGARRAAPRSRAQGVLPGVGARRRPAHAARQPHLGDVRPAPGRSSPTRARGSTRCARAPSTSRSASRRVGAATLLGPHRVRGAHDARARGAARCTRSRSSTSSSPTCRARRCRSTASAPGCSRCTRSCRCRGTSPSTSRSSRTAGSSTSGCSPTATRGPTSRSLAGGIEDAFAELLVLAVGQGPE